LKRLGRAGGAYFYNAFQVTKKVGAYKGMSVTISQVQPEYSPSIVGHSIAQMALSTNDLLNRIEIGWQVSPNLYGDNRPRLFTYRNVNGKGFYNRTIGGGYVTVDNNYLPGEYPVDINSVDIVYSFSIQHNDSTKRWELFYRGVLIGYYPDSIWSSGFTRGDYPSWYGEVYGDSSGSCTDMGSGRYGYETGAALLRDPVITTASGALQAVSATSILTIPVTNGSLYNFGSVATVGGKSQIRFGGPGKGPCP
jgi:hypothetical protein